MAASDRASRDFCPEVPGRQIHSSYAQVTQGAFSDSLEALCNKSRREVSGGVRCPPAEFVWDVGSRLLIPGIDEWGFRVIQLPSLSGMHELQLYKIFWCCEGFH